MERGVRAPLSPNEERALRRVADGRHDSLACDQAGREIAQLKKLRLVAEIDGELHLTPIGRRRCVALGDKACLGNLNLTW